MSLETNKAVARRFFDLFHEGGEGLVDEIFTEDFVHHSVPWASPGIDGMKELMEIVATGFSDFQGIVEDVVAEGNRVVMRLCERGVHTGDFLGLPATGRSFQYSSIHIFRIENGRIAEHWNELDTAGLKRQLGA